MAKPGLKKDRRHRDRPLPRLPHPSWRWSSTATDQQAPLSAEDFWSKLGI